MAAVVATEMTRHRVGQRRLNRPAAQQGRTGQSLIESVLVMFIVCMVFAGLYQLSQVFVAKQVLNWSAQCAVRARTVGFNQWMVEKCARVACIPNAGPMTAPDYEDPTPDIELLVGSLTPGKLWDKVLQSSPSSDQSAFELARIPEYLASLDESEASAILDYTDWNSVSNTSPDVTTGSGGNVSMLEAKVIQDFPLRIPLHRTFYASDSVRLTSKSEIESHYSLYIDDQSW